MKKLKVIITGATGMVGEGVLDVCLKSNFVEKVLVIVRKSTEINHPKLDEILHHDFNQISSIKDKLKGYDACYFCLGVSSVGILKEEYYDITYNLTMNFANALVTVNENMTFCYISGQGTNSTETSGSNWSRVKGKTENDLKRLPFKKVYAYRPGFIMPTKGLKQTHSFYWYIKWMYYPGRILFPDSFNLLKEIGLSMIYVTLKNFEPKILNGREIRKTAEMLQTNF